MSIALKLDTATGRLARFLAADDLDINVISARDVAAKITLGANLNSGLEVELGNVNADTRVLGDFFVDGSSTVSVDETVTGVFNANGDVNLGNNSGDTINLGGGTSDTVNLLNDLEPGAGVIGLGASVTEYFNEIWLIAVNDNGPDAVAYDLQANGTNAGAYAIGVDPALIANSTATDLMTMLDDLDAAITGGGGETLQDTYALGNTIAVTTANGALAFSNSADVTDILQLIRTFVGGGNALDIDMGPGNEAVTGRGLNLTSGTGLTGVLAFLNNLGSSNALQIQDGGTDVVIVSAGGAVLLTAEVASLFSTAAGNLTFDSIAAELVLQDVGNWISGAGTLSQSSDRDLAQVGAGEVLNGATSLLGALNRLAQAMDLDGQGAILEAPIENTVVMAAGDVVAQSTVAGRVTIGNANADANARNIGICLVGGTGDGGGSVLARVALNGFISDSGAAFTAGDALFAPDGTGRPVSTAPSGVGDVLQRVGYAHSATEYVLDFGPAVIL